MMRAVRDYFRTLADRFGTAWDRFWFTPSDPSTLSLLRLLTGIVALYSHATLSWDITRLFANGGLLPIDTVRQVEGTQALSYLNFITRPGDLWLVHILGLVVLVFFTLGAATRATSILALLVIVSDVNRGPMLSSQLEPVLIMVMLYLCIGPSGRYLSIDSLLRARRATADTLRAGTPTGSSLSSAATIALRLIQVHLAMIYGIMGLSKLMTEAWWNGMGVWWLATRTESRLIDVTWLHEYPYLLNFWTHAIVAFQLAFPILIWNRTARPLLLGLSVLLWVSLGMLTGQLAFTAMMLIANLAYVPPEIMKISCSRCFGERAEQVAAPPRGRATEAAKA